MRYRTASEAFAATSRCIKPWHTVCVHVSEQHEAAAWQAHKITTNQIVRAIREAKQNG